MRVKGAALRSSITYLREHFPAEIQQKVMESLQEDQRTILSRPILVSDWYDAELLYSFMHAVAEVSVQDERVIFHAMGRQSCDDGLNTVYKLFFKIGSPAFIIKRAAQVWGNYYDEGKMEVLDSSSKFAHLRLLEQHLPNVAMCMRVTGWMERAVEFSGGRNVQLDHNTCAHRGDQFCEWRASWE